MASVWGFWGDEYSVCGGACVKIPEMMRGPLDSGVPGILQVVENCEMMQARMRWRAQKYCNLRVLEGGLETSGSPEVRMILDEMWFLEVIGE